jgi:protein-S-isoprenylcysteine O-methyltransferase Ste14
MERAFVSAASLRWLRWRARLGFPLAAICLWLARPSEESILAGAAVAVVGLAVRAAAAGHLRKGETVAMSGPYARTRNPLYFGSGLLAAGFAVASRSWAVAALVTTFYVAIYPYLMRREEGELRARFGSAFDDYARRVPLFWPLLRARGGDSGTQFSWVRYANNREYQAAIGTAALLLGLWALSIWRG